MATIRWDVPQDESNSISASIDERRNDPFVAKRVSQNVVPTRVGVSNEAFWDAQLTALLTSKHRSGCGRVTPDLLARYPGSFAGSSPQYRPTPDATASASPARLARSVQSSTPNAILCLRARGSPSR